MPPWGRPPRGKAGVGRFMEDGEDVYRFQELDSDDERHGVSVDQGYQPTSNGKFNPDELYFNDMDIRAWERRAAGLDDLYEEYSGYPEDEGYYDDAGEPMTAAEYEELLFQRVLEKVRQARTTGITDVQLSQEELDAYQARLYRPWAPAASQQPTVRARPSSIISAPPALSGTSNSAIAAATSGNPSAGTSRSKKKEHRSSLFSPKSKKEKPSNRKRAQSNVSNASTQPPGFVVPGPGGQPTYAPINAYQGRLERDPLPASRNASRSASIGSIQTQTLTHFTPSREMPGAFPSPLEMYRPITPPQQERLSPTTPQFTQEPVEYQHSPITRSRSSSIHQAPSVVSLPVSYTGESYQYYTTGQSTSAQASSSQIPYTRRVATGTADNPYTAMPRRVPVHSSQASYSDPALNQRGSTAESDARSGSAHETAPQAESYKVQTVKPGTKDSTSGGSGGSRKKKGRKNRN